MECTIQVDFLSMDELLQQFVDNVHHAQMSWISCLNHLCIKWARSVVIHPIQEKEQNLTSE